MNVQDINGSQVAIPADMTFSNGNMGPGAFDEIYFRGVGITTADCDDSDDLYTGPFYVSDDNGEIYEVKTLDAARKKILSLAEAGRVELS